MERQLTAPAQQNTQVRPCEAEGIDKLIKFMEEGHPHAVVAKMVPWDDENFLATFLLGGLLLLCSNEQERKRLDKAVKRFCLKAAQSNDKYIIAKLLIHRNSLYRGQMLRALKKSHYNLASLTSFIQDQWIPSGEFNRDTLTFLFNSAFQAHYEEFVAMLLRIGNFGYSDIQLFEMALRARWVEYIVKKYKEFQGNGRAWSNEFKNLLGSTLLQYAKKHDEQMVYLLISLGATINSVVFVAEIWSDLSRNNQPSAAARTYELLRLFNHSGINEYREKGNPFSLYQTIWDSFSFDDTLTIPHYSWSGGYFAHCGAEMLKTLQSLPLRKKRRKKCLLTFATPVNKRNDALQTELMFAALFNRIAAVRALLAQNGIHVNAYDAYERTALIYAARYASPEVVKALLLAGAEPRWKDSTKLTALDHAIEANRYANALLLICAMKEKNYNSVLAKTRTYAEFLQSLSETDQVLLKFGAVKTLTSDLASHFETSSFWQALQKSYAAALVAVPR